jgi:ubiquinone/menaquinone biosynthesis C-methylase UbiE
VSESHHRYVADRYGERAQDYLTSQVHASGGDLDRIEAIARATVGARALDLGCGGGHVTYRTAPHVASVTAVDLAPEMLELVQRTAAERGLANVSVRQAAAEALPFEAAAFDLVLSRYSAHHWRDFEAGLKEARRVLAPGGRAVFADTVTSPDPLLDTHLQAIEVLRDPSHVRDYALAEWTAALARAGFSIEGLSCHRIRINFDDWVARSRTPEATVRVLRSLQDGAPQEARDYLRLEADGSFQLEKVLIECAAA